MNKYTEAIQGDDVVILCDGIPMGVGEILAALNAATQPADAALADGINEFLTRVQNYATEDAVREFPMTAIAHINGLIGIIRKQAAALRALSQPATVAQVPEVETYSADVTAARDFRIIASPDLSDYVLQWQITDGTIMTVTSVKVSSEGLAHTLGVIDRLRDVLPLSAAPSAKGGE